MRALLIEGSAPRSDTIQLALEEAGFHVERTLAKTFRNDEIDCDHDLLCIDLGAAMTLDRAALMQITSIAGRTPVLTFSSVSDQSLQADVMGLVVDEHITTPFCSEEVGARARSIVRRSLGHASPSVRIGKMVIDLENRRVEVDGMFVHFTVMEYKILSTLVLHKETIVTTESLLKRVFDDKVSGSANALKFNLFKLRKKLLAACGEGYIATVGKRGYMITDRPALTP